MPVCAILKGVALDEAPSPSGDLWLFAPWSMDARVMSVIVSAAEMARNTLGV